MYGFIGRPVYSGQSQDDYSDYSQPVYAGSYQSVYSSPSSSIYSNGPFYQNAGFNVLQNMMRKKWKTNNFYYKWSIYFLFTYFIAHKHIFSFIFLRLSISN